MAATLQNVEMRKPNSPASETFTILEKIFAPSASRAFGVGAFGGSLCGNLKRLDLPILQKFYIPASVL